MRPGVPLQIESVIESFSTERAKVPLDIRMALHVPIEQTLECEAFVAHSATEMGLAVLRRYRGDFGLLLRPDALS